MKKLFCCYSLNLRNYLTKHGIRYELCGLNPNGDHSMFWVYIRDEKLTKILDEWLDKNNK